jgi:hypothetical protein
MHNSLSAWILIAQLPLQNWSTEFADTFFTDLYIS